ncbi:MAG: Tat pathway signal protein [Thermovibrio sp.]|nr:MAG: Tat pathway signal protein [Thermovibrio sp.]
MVKEGTVERRKFLKDVFKTGIGVAAGLTVGSALSFASQGKVKLPLPYVKLDPKRVAEKAYDGYYEHECAYGVFNAVIGELQEKVGGPYLGIPTLMFWYGGGGAAGWGTLCGTLNAAGAIFNLTCKQKDFKAMIDTLYEWYQITPLPTYIPCKGNWCKQPFPKSVSHSPLCHVSVQRWCKNASIYFGKPILYNSKERSDRCARLTATVAAKVVEMLNDYHFGNFKPHKVKGSQKTKMDCRLCHEVTMKELS